MDVDDLKIITFTCALPDDLDADMSTSPAEHSEDAEDTGGVSGESGEPARPTIRAQPKLERRERPVIQDAKLRKLQDAIQPGSTPTGMLIFYALTMPLVLSSI